MIRFIKECYEVVLPEDEWHNKHIAYFLNKEDAKIIANELVGFWNEKGRVVTKSFDIVINENINEYKSTEDILLNKNNMLLIKKILFNNGFIDEACCIYKNGFLIKEDAISGLFSCEEFAWRDAFEKMYK